MFFLDLLMGSSATRTASENTSFTQSRLLAEHSKYPEALIDFASLRASVSLIKFVVEEPWRRSDCVPTSIIGTFGACLRSSGTHLSLTFSKEVLDPIE